MMNGRLLAWGSRKQGCIASSTTEAEYIGAHLVGDEIVWMRGLLKEFEYAQNFPTTLYSDNQAAIRLKRNLESNKRIKHIDVKYHIICRYEQDGVIDIVYIPSSHNIADNFSKPLPRQHFQH